MRNVLIGAVLGGIIGILWNELRDYGLGSSSSLYVPQTIPGWFAYYAALAVPTALIGAVVGFFWKSAGRKLYERWISQEVAGRTIWDGRYRRRVGGCFSSRRRRCIPFGSISDEARSARVEGRPWLWLIIAFPAIFANFAVFGIAAIWWLSDDIRFGEALRGVPYHWVPVTLLFASMIIAAIEKAHEWLPKVPRVAAALLQLWVSLLLGPVLGPVGEWRSIRERRVSGEASCLSGLVLAC